MDLWGYLADRENLKNSDGEFKKKPCPIAENVHDAIPLKNVFYFIEKII